MKNLTLIIQFIAAVFVLGLQSCKDECKDVTCMNSGICDEETGECDCASGYVGENCGEAISDKFAGAWTVSEVCTPGNSPSYNLTFSGVEGSPDSLVITGIATFSAYTVRGTVGEDGLSFSFPRQSVNSADSYESVSGSISQDFQTLNLTYNYYFLGSSSPSQVCVLSGSK